MKLTKRPKALQERVYIVTYAGFVEDQCWDISGRVQEYEFFERGVSTHSDPF